MNMSGSQQSERTPLWASPGLIVAVLFSLLVLMIAIGVVVTNRGGSPLNSVTIAELRAHPDRYDGRTVILNGLVEDVRQLPVLDQYALYTFRDDSGSMWTLTQRGVPPRDGETVQLTAVYHSRITLDEQIQSLIEAQFGSLAGSLAGSMLPGLAINAVFLEHMEYQLDRDD
jgi:hypothetical protein